jgi:hypothetical protein
VAFQPIAPSTPPPPLTAIMPRPFDISLSDSTALAIFSGCISQGLTASGPRIIFDVAMAAGASDRKQSQFWW